MNEKIFERNYYKRTKLEGPNEKMSDVIDGCLQVGEIK